MEVTHHVVQFDVDPGTFPFLDVGSAGCEQRFDIGPVDTGLGGPHEDRFQGLAVFLPHTNKISLLKGRNARTRESEHVAACESPEPDHGFAHKNGCRTEGERQVVIQFSGFFYGSYLRRIRLGFAPDAGKGILDLLLEAVNQLAVGVGQRLLGFDLRNNAILYHERWYGDAIGS